MLGKKDAGAIMIITVFVFILMLAFLALAIGTGFVATQYSRLQTVTNVGAMSALDYYISNPDGLEVDRRQDAVDRANFVIKENDILGIEFTLDEVATTSQPDNSGELLFGSYVRQGPSPRGFCNTFPCFEESVPDDGGNSVLLRLKTQSDNPLEAPFARFLGSGEYQMQSETVSTIVDTCVVHLLDVSVSTVSSNFLLYSSNPQGFGCSGAAFCSNCSPANYGEGPVDPFAPRDYPMDCRLAEPGFDDGGTRRSLGSLFALRAHSVLRPTDNVPWININPFGPEETVPGAYPYDWVERDLTPDYIYWSNYADDRLTYTGSSNPFLSFKSDYVLRRVNRGEFVLPTGITPPSNVGDNFMLINKQRQPSPLREFMLGANVVIRIIERLPSVSNRGMFAAFTGTFGNRLFPDPLPPDDPVCPNCPTLTENLSFLSQLTNMDLAGGVTGSFDSATGYGIDDGTEVFPNYLDYGFFPMSSGQAVQPGVDPIDSASNITLAVFDAANTLIRECPGEARRQIYLYSDMLPTCRFAPGPPEFQSNVSASCGLIDDSAYFNYAFSEYVILSELVPFLQEAGVSVNVFFDGRGVRPHILNIKDPEFDGDVDDCIANDGADCWLNFQTGSLRNYGGIPAISSPPGHFGGSDPETDWPGQVPDTLNPPCGQGFNGALFNCDNLGTSDREAFDNLVSNNPNTLFGRAIGLGYELSAQTGGLFCPLMEVGAVGDYYDHDLDYGDSDAQCQAIFNEAPGTQGKTPCILRASLRVADAVEQRAFEYIPKSRQAARCAQQVAGSNPYLQEVPLEVCEDSGQCYLP